ncbi:MAG TPA: adenosylmethionine decarboxylase [Candidatus Latescibacteria bacterium]|jgi:spermidine synthase|nr:adenosylmethionine decarboxylase [Candidatus Latescibacterota bacterium]|tara:strand:- start:593 stop:988 length:396 start_codon:yes stop_codon:yes gene_type:complete
MSTPRPTAVDTPISTALGRQLLVDLYGCDRDQLDDETYVRQSLLAAAEHAGATVIDALFHSFSPCGVTGTVSIQESHLSIHTWPEHLYAAVDIFTCGDSVAPWRAYESLKSAFSADRGSAVEVHRGRPDLL